MHRRYEFIDSDDKACPVLSPVEETAKKDNDHSNSTNIRNFGHESNITTVTDLMQQCAQQPPPELPAPRIHRQKESTGDVDVSATQLSLPQLKAKQRPPALNLRNPVHIGMVSRNTNRYQIEHTAIKSSKAEHFDSCDSDDNTCVYDYTEDSPTIAPLNIPKRNDIGATNSLQAYTEWRENLKPVHTASQGSIRIMVPTREENPFGPKIQNGENQRQVAGPYTAQHTHTLNHVRSRSTLGIREDNNNARYRQSSGDSGYTASEYSTDLTPGQGSGITRSDTTKEGSYRNRQHANGALAKDTTSGAVMNNAHKVKDVVPPSPFTPLTPFIMRVSGAPAGVEQGPKTLFGEHGWLEDTAASESRKPKMEKTGRFMESLKRRAREIVRHTFPRPVVSVARTNMKLTCTGRQHIVQANTPWQGQFRQPHQHLPRRPRAKSTVLRARVQPQHRTGRLFPNAA